MRHHRAAGLILALGLTLTALGAEAAAQVTPSVLQGTVRDSLGNPVPDARLELRDAAGRLVAGTGTDVRGRYMLAGLPSGGPYTLVMERLGFRTSRRGGVYLASGERHRLDVTVVWEPLELAGVQAIAATDPVFGRTRTGAATLIEERQIETAPTVDRSITAFAALSPMAAIQEDAISVAGQNSRFNALRVDGTLSQDVFGLSPSGVPGGQANARALPLGAIRQYSVLVAPFDVRQSGFTGGLLNAVTRSGGEEWEATAFAYYRDAAFTGAADDSDVVSSSGRGATPGFRTELGGFTMGGPIRGVRVFAAGEFEHRRRPLPGFHLGATDPVRVRLAPDSVSRLSRILREQYGHQPGDAGQYELDNPLGNVFARIDVPLASDHSLSVRYNWIAAAEDVPARHLGYGAYELSSVGTRVESETHSASARLASRLGDRTRYQAALSVQRTRDATRARSEDPLVEVSMASRVGENTLLRDVRAGADPLAHLNELEQTVVQLSNSLTHGRGDHLLTVGVEVGMFSARRSYLPASRGVWRFNSLADLERNEPWTYERLILAEDADPTVDVGLLQVSAYLQDEWALGDRLTMSLGARVDLPISPDQPTHNADLAAISGIATDRVPALPLFSPRVGFNWRPPLDGRTQVRGGVGVFTGVPPLAWIADAFANTGLRTRSLYCSDQYLPGGGRLRGAPPMTGGAPPGACLAEAGTAEPDVTFFARDFRFPQDLRVSLAVDQQLPLGVVGTVEGVYTRSIHQVSLEDLNLPPAAATPLPSGAGFPSGVGSRPYFGVPRPVPDRFGPLEPTKRWEGYGRVIRIGNRSRNAALAAAVELRRRFTNRLDLRLAYTYTRAVDTRSLLYPDAALNYGLSPTRGDPSRPGPRPSAFDRPHRVLASAWARLARWGEGFDASVSYVGQSGLPYSYVYETDMNGDGYPGPGAADAYNDLYFASSNPAQIPASIGSSALLLQLQAIEPCLRKAEGGISARNACRAPWSNRVDLRLSQEVRTPVGDVRLTADMMNFLNLLSRDWGLVQVVSPAVPILRVDQRLGCPGLGCTPDAPLTGSYSGPRRLNPETGGSVAELPYTASLPDSQWRAQLGIRIAF